MTEEAIKTVRVTESIANKMGQLKYLLKFKSINDLLKDMLEIFIKDKEIRTRLLKESLGTLLKVKVKR